MGKASHIVAAQSRSVTGRGTTSAPITKAAASWMNRPAAVRPWSGEVSKNGSPIRTSAPPAAKTPRVASGAKVRTPARSRSAVRSCWHTNATNRANTDAKARPGPLSITAATVTGTANVRANRAPRTNRPRNVPAA